MTLRTCSSKMTAQSTTTSAGIVQMTGGRRTAEARDIT